MVVVAFPDNKSSKTKFEFDFWIEGEEFPIYEHYYNEYIAQNPNGDVMLIIVSVCVGLVLCIILCCAFFCIRACCKRCCGSKGDDDARENTIAPHDAMDQLEYNKKHAG